MNKSIIGYDNIKENKQLPNCLPKIMVDFIEEECNYDFINSKEKFYKKFGITWPLWKSAWIDMFIEFKKFVPKTIHQIKEERLNGFNYKWFYIIEPYGNFESFIFTPYSNLLLENISEMALDEIINGNGQIVINYIIDGGLSMTQQNFLKIKEFCDKKAIPHQKIHFIFQDFKLDKSINLINFNCKYNTYNLALWEKSQEYSRIINNDYGSYWDNDYLEEIGNVQTVKNSIQTVDDLERSINEKTKKKDFLFFCRHVKKERLEILDLLNDLGLENNLVSWNDKFMKENYFLLADLLKKDDGKFNFVKKLLTTSKTIDYNDISKIHGMGFESKEPYFNSFISIVSESIFFQNDLFKSGYLSEKIWKPIGHCHPFILLGPSESLKYIKSLGFKTFSPFINEEYDEVENDEDRLNFIKNEIIKFSNLSFTKKHEFLKNVKNILIHNQKLFLEISTTRREEYILKYSTILNPKSKKII